MLDMLKEAAKKAIPKQLCLFNGVAVRTYKWRNGTIRPDFEEAIAGELREHVSADDRVVIVGGGHGVCSTIAATAGAAVTVYEPGALWVDTIRETAKLNDVDIDVVHAAVGEMHDVWSSPKGADLLDPEELPECDWLVLDCEGAELDILKGLQIRPARLSVEIHPPVVDTIEAGAQIMMLDYDIYKTIEGEGADVLHAVKE